MNDDKTIYAAKGAPTATGGGNKTLLIIGGVGCGLLLCLVLIIGGVLLLTGNQFSNITASLSGATATATPAPIIPTPTATPEPSPAPSPTTSAGEAEQPKAASPTPAASNPVISMITFALGATDTYEPVNPNITFDEGITEVHAIFDYSGMQSGSAWERVWYLDGKEILRNAAKWTDKESGRFDYFIDAGGDPLSPGEWTLELFVNGKLAAKGAFSITPQQPKASQATATPTPEAATPTPTPKPAASSGGGGVYKLLYSKWDGGQHNLYVADTNGKNEQFIIGRAAGPSWSPDGQFIFFYGQEGIDRQTVNGVEYVFDGISNGIVSMKAAPIPTNPGDIRLFQGLDWKQGSARWANVAPNGQMVAYDAKPGGDYRIYFLGTADNKQYKFEILGEQGDWSPDGQKVVYRSGRDGKTGIWISNRDDTGHTNITASGSDSFPAWSPNGKTIAFSRDEGGNVDIYTMNVDGSNIKRITDAPGPDSLPVYTPSGDIIFRSARSGSWGIWKMSGSGANQKEIIPNAGVGNDWAFSRMDVK
jgi:Tol biopolymer transport system component